MPSNLRSALAGNVTIINLPNDLGLRFVDFQLLGIFVVTIAVGRIARALPVAFLDITFYSR